MLPSFTLRVFLEGLTYLHHPHDRRHIIHRDLKPQNVMVENLGYSVLIDLGFGKSILLVARKDGFRAGSHHFCIASSKICHGKNLHMLRNSNVHGTGVDQLYGS
jgi:serine/threonine protein kinase